MSYILYQGKRVTTDNKLLYIPSTLLIGLISYWKFDASLGYAKDELGNYDGSLYNVTQNQSGIINESFRFDGSTGSSYVEIYNDDVFDIGTGDITISLWARTDEENIIRQGLIASYVQMQYIEINNNIIQGYIRDNNLNEDVIVSGTSIMDGDWHHIVLVFKYGNVAYYVIDNNKKSDVDISEVYTAPITDIYNLKIGYSYSTRYFEGNIDEVGFWKRALTIDEISTLYNNGNGLSYSF